MKLADNIRISDEAGNWILRHYMWPDTDDPSQLHYVPILVYSLETTDGVGRKIAGSRHFLSMQRPGLIGGNAVVTAFENGRKFVAIDFYPVPHDENARYMVEYADRVWYVLKE